LIGVKQGYAPLDGIEMYYETHGTGSNPVVLIHGAFSGIGTSFGTVLPLLAETRQVIAVELDGHARTAGSDRPIRVETLASDVVGLLTHLGIERADLFGYSLGAGVALQAALDHPARVRKLVLASLGHTTEAMQPGMSEGMDMLQPEMLHGSPYHAEYVSLAPKQEEFPTRVVREYGWSHSLHVDGEARVRAACLGTPAGQPWIIHAAEGVDAQAHGEPGARNARDCTGRPRGASKGAGPQ